FVGLMSKEEQLVAALCLGPAGEDRLALLLDDSDETARMQALIVQMLLELKSPQGAPTRCLTCLSAKSPRIRLAAPRALERYAGPTLFRDYVVELVNDRSEQAAWKLTAEAIDTLAEFLAYGSPRSRALAAYLLRYLFEKEPGAWEQFSAIHSERFAGE